MMGVNRTLSALFADVAATIAKASAMADWPGDERDRQARVEAEQLICHVGRMTKLEFLTRLSESVSPDLAGAVFDLAEKRGQGQPLAYLLGSTTFYGRVFRTRVGGLIPRPDTEILVDRVVQFVQTHRPHARVVDVGTGSGCIAVTIAKECQGTRVFAIDVSAQALHLAQENASLNEANVSFIEADGLYWLQSSVARSSIHVLVSNPPYIPTAEVHSLDESVRIHEPMLALDGGEDGLVFYRAFAALQPKSLFEQGPAGVFLEVGDGQAGDVAALFQSNPDWDGFEVSVHKDMRGVDRVVQVCRI